MRKEDKLLRFKSDLCNHPKPKHIRKCVERAIWHNLDMMVGFDKFPRSIGG
ncbi:MAG: hypothetical protein ACW986_08810 [Promethearchaeota archaeon]|jgi:hypothetical protein